MIHTEQHDSVEGSAGKNGGIPVQHGVEGLFQLQRTTTKGCQLILVPVYFNIGGIFQKMYNVHILHIYAGTLQKNNVGFFLLPNATIY